MLILLKPHRTVCAYPSIRLTIDASVFIYAHTLTPLNSSNQDEDQQTASKPVTSTAAAKPVVASSSSTALQSASTSQQHATMTAPKVSSQFPPLFQPKPTAQPQTSKSTFLTQDPDEDSIEESIEEVVDDDKVLSRFIKAKDADKSDHSVSSVSSHGSTKARGQ